MINHPNPSQQSQQLIERSLKHVWHPCTQMRQHQSPQQGNGLPLIAMVRGEGAWLYDADGRAYLDAVSSWWTNLFGHNDPGIAQAISQQLARLDHVMLAGFTHPPVVELSERLAALTDGALGHAFYASDGASAVEIALKMSVHYWRNQGQPQKNHYVCLAGAYHGETVGALAVTDVPLFSAAYVDLVRRAGVLPSPDARLAVAGEDAVAVAERAAAAAETLLAEAAATTAAVIVEPLLQCAGGMAVYDSHYLTRLRAMCDRYAIHLIADEIAVGFGRTGSLFAYQQAKDALPDFLCLSKGISGGVLPLSVVLSRDAIYQAFWHDEVDRGFLHSHSYTGNPLACSAALAVLDRFATTDVFAAIEAQTSRLYRALQGLAGHPSVRHLRRLGSVVACDLVSDDPHLMRRFYRAALGEGVLLRPLGKTVYAMPPYRLTDAEVDHLAAGWLRALEISLAG